MSTANNTDVQPDIFQNPVLIFLNEQFKAHENILLQRKEVDRAFVCESEIKQTQKEKMFFFFLSELATVNNHDCDVHIFSKKLRYSITSG